MNRPGQGRKRKPIEQHKLDGTLRGYHEAESVPGPITNRPICPPHLSAFDSAAPVLFDQVCTWLEKMGTLSESDSPTIEAFVESYFHHRKCLALLNGQYVSARVIGYEKDSKGKTARGKDGKAIRHVEIRRNPLDAQCRHWLDSMNRYAAQLGLSPSARASLFCNSPPPAESTGLDTILSVFDGQRGTG
jgi:P27 family predicted phage terminase small subunit